MGLLIGVGSTRPVNAFDYYYGIQFDSTVSNPVCTRIGKAELHASLPIQSRMVRCLLNDDGTVNHYLDANDSTKLDSGASAVLDGSQGQVMVELPEMYVRFEKDGTTYRALMSPAELPGFTKWEKVYVSAYEAALDRTNLKLSSVVNTAAQYRGGNNTAEWDGTYRSLLGKPVTSISTTTFRTYARNRDASGEAHWTLDLYSIQKRLFWLFAIEYATLNSQATFNAALDANGYHQGGLGPGVSEMSSWGDYNSYNPIIPCGVTNELGNKTGIVTHNVIASDGETVHYAAPVPAYRGVENPFGHIFKWCDGAKFLIAAASEASPTSKFYVCDDPTKFTSSGVADYRYVGDIARVNGYVKTIMFGTEGDIVPIEVGGGSTTYFCDYFYTNIPSSGVAEKVVAVGGHSASGSHDGFAYVHSSSSASTANANYGSRLCFIP